MSRGESKKFFVSIFNFFPIFAGFCSSISAHDSGEVRMSCKSSESDHEYKKFVSGPWSRSLDKGLFKRVSEKFAKYGDDALVEGCALCLSVVLSHRREQDNEFLKKELTAVKNELGLYKLAEEELALEVMYLRDKCESLRAERDAAADEAEAAKEQAIFLEKNFDNNNCN